MAHGGSGHNNGWRQHLRPWNIFAALLLGAIGFLLWTVLASPAQKTGEFARYLDLIASAAKYSGILLSSALAIYGITNEFKEGSEGAKRLTRAGRRAVFVSVLLAVVSVLGTLADSQMQSQKSDEANARTRDELKKVYELTKADLEAKSAAEQKQLEQTYTQTTKSLREGYEASSAAIENALRPVESVTMRATFRFPESLRPGLPKDYWSSPGGVSPKCASDFVLPVSCTSSWSLVSEEFFHPMLSFDTKLKTRKLPIGDGEHFDDYGLSMFVFLSRDPLVSLAIAPCEWKSGGDPFSPKPTCAPEAFFFLNRLPGDYLPDAPESPKIQGVRWQGDPRRLELAVQFRVDPETFDKLDRSNFKLQHRPVAGNFLRDASGGSDPIEVQLTHRPRGASHEEISAGVESLVRRLPLSVTLEFWVNDDPTRTRTVLLAKEGDVHRVVEAWWKASAASSLESPSMRVYRAQTRN